MSWVFAANYSYLFIFVLFNLVVATAYFSWMIESMLNLNINAIQTILNDFSYTC